MICRHYVIHTVIFARYAACLAASFSALPLRYRRCVAAVAATTLIFATPYAASVTRYYSYFSLPPLRLRVTFIIRRLLMSLLCAPCVIAAMRRQVRYARTSTFTADGA